MAQFSTCALLKLNFLACQIKNQLLDLENLYLREDSNSQSDQLLRLVQGSIMQGGKMAHAKKVATAGRSE